jgi:hypothetical protein
VAPDLASLLHKEILTKSDIYREFGYVKKKIIYYDIVFILQTTSKINIYMLLGRYRLLPVQVHYTVCVYGALNAPSCCLFYDSKKTMPGH